MEEETPSAPVLERERHKGMFSRFLQVLPWQYQTQDGSRMTLLYFAVSALDLLGSPVAESEHVGICNWVHDQVVTGTDSSGRPIAGFRPGPSIPTQGGVAVPNLAMTYTALMVLRLCGDDLSRLDRAAVARGVAAAQQPDGAFSSVAGGISLETDMRFCYCACAILTLLEVEDFSKEIDLGKMLEYIHASQSYDGAFGQGPQMESHGGSTYCAVASLVLCGRLEELRGRDQLLRWCLLRNNDGYQGRIGKLNDTCYSFWIGGAAAMLGDPSLLDAAGTWKFASQCQTKYGGFSKVPETHPDILHSYMALQGLALCGDRIPTGLLPLDPSLGRRRA